MIELTVKQTLTSKILFNTVILLGRLKLISLDTVIKLINRSIKRGAFRCKVGKGDWKKLDHFEFTLSEGA